MTTFDENGITTVDILIDGMHCGNCAGKVKEALEAEGGVEIVNVSVGKAQVGYIPQVVSETYIESLIEQQGFTIKRDVEKKGVVGRFIDRMIASNQTNFGNERLDCCDLSSKKPINKASTD